MHRATVSIETMRIPTYPVPAPEMLPMFAESRNHQGTTGNPYPNRVVQQITHEKAEDREYTAVRLENDYIRLIVLPELGGRIFEAYDKINDYHFLYRQHVIKPAMIGAYGSWISGGLEFNWPFHHRPSTFLPVDFTTEQRSDGAVVCWLSECDPTERTKGMVGIVLRPDRSYFETAVRITNRTELRHQFLWWENGAVRIHDKYRIIFPPDVHWVHHHYDRNHISFPLAKGRFGSQNFTEETDISWLKNSLSSNSYFAAPSEYEFFGGYDYAAECGTIHVADPHVSPGKKMFTWGMDKAADTWEERLTDSDGKYCELMAGSFSDDQPDFTWIEPYETKEFSQFWYPTRKTGYVNFANLDAALSVDRESGVLVLNATKPLADARISLSFGKTEVLSECFSLEPCEALELPFEASKAQLKKPFRAVVTDAEGAMILDYTEDLGEGVPCPADNPGIPTPDRLTTAQELFLAGEHIDQYRDPHLKPDLYYRAALRIDPEYLPALKGLAEYEYRTARYKEAEEHLLSALQIEGRYNQNPADGTANYLLGLVYLRTGRTDEAYRAFMKSSWSANTASAALTKAAAIDGQRGDYREMLTHARAAMKKERENPEAFISQAAATARMNDRESAEFLLSRALATDALFQEARFLKLYYRGDGVEYFYDPERLNSNPAAACIDAAFDFLEAGLTDEATAILEGLHEFRAPSMMSLYLLSDLYRKAGKKKKADALQKKASALRVPEIYPYRLQEIEVLRNMTEADPTDASAWNLLGCILYDKKHYEEAASCWEKAVKADPGFCIPVRNLAVSFYSHLGKKEEALELMKKAHVLFPEHEQYIVETAYLMAALGVPAKERVAFLEERIRPESTDHLYREMIYACQADGRHDLALQYLSAHEFVPGEGGDSFGIDAWLFSRTAKGRLLLGEGKAEEALKEFEKALDFPANLHEGLHGEALLAEVLYYTAEARLKLGDEKGAQSLREKIAALDTGALKLLSGRHLFYAAKILELSGKAEEARVFLTERLDLDEKRRNEPAYPGQFLKGGRFFYQSFIDDPAEMKEAGLLEEEAWCLLALGKKEEAKESFRRSLSIQPDNVRAAFELRMLN